MTDRRHPAWFERPVLPAALPEVEPAAVVLGPRTPDDPYHDLAEAEPLDPGHPLLDRESVVVTPHIATATDDGKLRLEQLLVDRGGAAHRINSRVRRVIAQRKALPKFHALMKAGRFRITMLTGTREQAAKIERRVSRRPFGPIDVTTFLIPELAELMMLRK